MGKLVRVILSFLYEHFWLMVLVLFFFIAGMFFGSLSLNHLQIEQQTALKEYLDQLYQALANTAVAQTPAVWETVLNNAGLGFALWFLGLTVIGLPLLALIILVRGFILGFTLSFLVQDPSITSTALCLLGVLPQNLLFIPILIIGGTLAVSFSLQLVRGRISGAHSFWTSLFSYTLSMVFVALGLILAGLIEGLLVPVLIRLFLPV